MGSSTVPAPTSGGATSDNWVLISSVTPTNGASTVTFTSISAKTKIMLRINATGTSPSNMTVTFNGDTGAKYNFFALRSNSSTAANVTPYAQFNNTGLGLGFGTSGKAAITITEADTVNSKAITGQSLMGADTAPLISGSYLASAAISSITITSSGTFDGTGTIAIYGVTA